MTEAESLWALFFAMVVQVIVPPIPAEVLTIGAGNRFGPWKTVFAAGGGLFLGSLAVYWIGNKINQRFSRFFSQDKVRKIIAGFEKYDTWILWVRILPYNPSDIISYAAGVSKVNFGKFVAISFFTSFIRCAILARMGSEISSWKNIITILAILLISGFLSVAFLYKKK
jgi:uncharacterized membrane protein YdjX (TVP38/TMEM64 family)